MLSLGPSCTFVCAEPGLGLAAGLLLDLGLQLAPSSITSSHRKRQRRSSHYYRASGNDADGEDSNSGSDGEGVGQLQARALTGALAAAAGGDNWSEADNLPQIR
jgi:hypothetical protein